MATIPARMTAIGIKAPGGPEMLQVEERPVPSPAEGHGQGARRASVRRDHRGHLAAARLALAGGRSASSSRAPLQAAGHGHHHQLLTAPVSAGPRAGAAAILAGVITARRYSQLVQAALTAAAICPASCLMSGSTVMGQDRAGRPRDTDRAARQPPHPGDALPLARRPNRAGRGYIERKQHRPDLPPRLRTGLTQRQVARPPTPPHRIQHIRAVERRPCPPLRHRIP